MLRQLTATVLVFPAIFLAGQTQGAPEEPKKIPALSLLPAGSELKDVRLPRYDKDYRLSSVLKAKTMRLVGDDKIEGITVGIEFFNPDETSRGRIDLAKALVEQNKGLLSTKEPVKIQIDGMKANGTGLYYNFNEGKGFLLGPATTILHQPLKTTMNTPDSPFRAMALVGMSLLTQSLLAAPPPAITRAQLDAIQSDAASRASVAASKAAESGAALKKDLADAETASAAAANFLVQNDLPPVKTDDADEEPKPLEVPADANNTVISCDGGIYFDPDEGVLVYLKNVVVKDPRFDLSGANEVKVFFEKKPVEPKKPADPEKPAKPGDKKAGKLPGGDVGANIGDAERIVATGVIKIKQKPADGKEPIEASGAIFTYNVKTDEATLSGGFPWVRQGARFFSSKKSDNLLRIYPNESRFDTPGGGWNMGFPVPNKKKAN